MSPLLSLVAFFVAPSHTLRLHLTQGQKLSVSLKVDRNKPTSSGEIRHTVTINNANGDFYAMTDDLRGMTIDGKDRSTDLANMLKVSAAKFTWNNRAQRSGDITGLSMSQQNEDLMPVLQEAGLYLCEFPEKAVQAGDSWYGSTTATGGCTAGRYRLIEYREEGGKQLAIVYVTDIQFQVEVAPIGPMVMTVDLKTGLPEKVEYSVRGKKSGRVSHYVQTISTK